MKKIIGLFILIGVSLAISAQSVTRDLIYLKDQQTYYKYTGTAADTINGGTIDTLRFPFRTSLDAPIRMRAEVTLTARVGADTTYVINVYGRQESTQAWTKITDLTTTSSAVATVQYPVVNNVSEVVIAIGDSTVNSTTPNACLKYTYTPSNQNLYWIDYMVEVIASGNDAVGTGVKVTGFKVKMWKK